MPYFTQEEVIKVGAYMRLSREDEGANKESNSIATQRALITDYVNSHDMTLVDEYVDDGYTGTNFNRPGFKALLEDCKTQKVNCVIVKDLSRFGRNATEVGRHLLETFPRMGVRFIAITDDHDSNNDPFTLLDIGITFKNLINEWYSADISRKVRAAFEVMRNKGDFLCGIPPYGYMKDPNDRHHLIIDESRAPVIRLIFDLKMAGYGNDAIARFLTAKEIETPGQRLNREAGIGRVVDEDAEWLPTSVVNILQNETYTGTMVSAKRGRPNYKISKLKSNDKVIWTRVEGKHEAIISKEIFNYVQDLFTRSQSSMVTGKVRPLTGFVRCPDCGMLMIHFGSPNSRYEYFNCSSHIRHEGCFSHNITQKKLEGAVLGAIRMQIEYLVRARAAFEESGESSYREDSIKRIEAEIDEQVRQEKRLMDMKAGLYRGVSKGNLPPEQFKHMEAHYSGLQKNVEEKIRELQEERNRIFREQMNILPWIDSIMKFRNLKELTRESVIMLVDFIYIHKDRTVDVHFRYHDEITDLLSTTMKRVMKEESINGKESA